MLRGNTHAGGTLSTVGSHRGLRYLAVVGAVVAVTWLLLRGGTGDKPSRSVASPPIRQGISEATAKSYAGVYRIDSYTENTEGCAVPGAAVVGAPQYLAVEPVQLFGARGVQVVACNDPVECDATRESIRAGKGGSVSTFIRYLTEEGSPVRLTGFFGMGGYGDPDKKLCFNRFYEDLVMTLPETSVLRIEARKKRLPDLPLEGRGCSIDTAAMKGEAAPLPCTSMLVITARRST